MPCRSQGRHKLGDRFGALSSVDLGRSDRPGGLSPLKALMSREYYGFCASYVLVNLRVAHANSADRLARDPDRHAASEDYVAAGRARVQPE